MYAQESINSRMRLACAQGAYAQESINPGPLKKGCARTVLSARRVCWKTTFVACTGICLVLYLSGLSTSTAADSLSSLSILRAHPDGRRRSGRRGDLLSQQPHNAAPLQPVFCFSHPPTSDQYMCVGAPRKSDPTVHPAIDHGPSGQYQDSDSS